MKPLKIGLVIDDSLDKTDGVQQYVLAIGEWYKSKGHRVHYLAGQTKRTDLANIHSLSRNIAVRFNHNRMSIPLPASKSRIRSILKQQQFDVIHVQMPYSPWLGHRVIKAIDKKTVVVATFHIVGHSPAVLLSTKLLAVLCRSSVKRINHVLAVSTAAQDYVLESYGLNSRVVPNVVDYSRFKKAKPLIGVKDKKTIIFMGRLVPRKGCLLLLKALSILSKDGDLNKVRVLICGKGPLESECKSYVRQNGLIGCVQFEGYISEQDKPGYLASADIAVFPSTGGESFGIVLIEAMSSGRSAVLGGNNVGYASVLVDNQSQLFELNEQTLADKLGLLLKDESERLKMAEIGSKIARQFDINIVGQELLDIYRS
jgi:phosphatidylinositol alpha-mannosyltransferase